MKFRIILIACAAMMMAACCGNSGNKSSCKSQEKVCSKTSAEKAGCNLADVKKIISAMVFVKPEKVDEFLEFTKELIEKSRAEEGCISYSLYQDPQDRSKFMFFEEWKNQAAVDFHFETEHFKKFVEALDNFASAAPIITIYDTISEKRE